jgi:hypothetical protein
MLNLRPRNITHGFIPVYGVIIGMMGWMAFKSHSTWKLPFAVSMYWLAALATYTTYAREHPVKPVPQEGTGP